MVQPHNMLPANNETEKVVIVICLYFKEYKQHSFVNNYSADSQLNIF